jgi:hypothetical protein
VAGWYGQSRTRSYIVGIKTFDRAFWPGLLTKASDQDFATMPRLTFNRKDMAGQSIGIATAMTGISSADSTRPLSVPMKSERGALVF